MPQSFLQELKSITSLAENYIFYHYSEGQFMICDAQMCPLSDVLFSAAKVLTLRNEKKVIAFLRVDGTTVIFACNDVLKRILQDHIIEKIGYDVNQKILTIKDKDKEYLLIEPEQSPILVKEGFHLHYVEQFNNDCLVLLFSNDNKTLYFYSTKSHSDSDLFDDAYWVRDGHYVVEKDSKFALFDVLSFQLNGGWYDTYFDVPNREAIQ